MEDNLPQIKRIIVPLDGSELAETALDVASVIATATGAHVDLVTVALTHHAPLESQMDRVTRESLSHAETALRTRHSEVERVLLSGAPAEAINDYVAESNADLIVVATHGRSGLRKLLLGSVADRLISLSNIPVLTVRANGNGSFEPPLIEMKVERIVVPVDGSDSAGTAMPFALSLAKLLSAQSALVFAEEGGQSDAGERQVRAFSRVLSEQGIPVESNVLPGSPGEVIVGSVRTGDIVVMTSLSSTGVARGSHRGSVADYVVKNSPVPVMIVPPKGYLGSAI